MKTAVEFFLKTGSSNFLHISIFRPKKGAFTHSFLLNFHIKNNHIFA